MSLILIGSRALAIRTPHILSRKPKDFDFVCTQKDYESWFDANKSKIEPEKVYFLEEYNKHIIEGKKAICEFEIIQPSSSNEMLASLVETDPQTIKTDNFGYVPSKNLLFAIKQSHRFKKFNSPQGFPIFIKNCVDWHALKSIGAKIEEKHQAFLSKREEETYNYKHPKLNVSKMDFFSDNGITQIVDHDCLHEIVAIGDKPAYTYYLKDNEAVLTSKKKFFECDETIRLNGCLEEAFTLALERSLLPHPGQWSSDFAFKFALGKVSTSICSGYFREYCFENFFKLLKLYSNLTPNYYEKYQLALKDGKVKFLK